MQGQQLPLPSRQQASQDSWEGADRQPKRRRHQQASAQAGPSKRQKQDQAVAQPDTSNLQEPSNSSQTEDDSVSDGNEGQVQSSSSQAQESAGQDLAPGHADPSEPVGPSDPSDSGQAQHNHLTPAPAQAIVGSASTDMEEADAAAEEDRSTEALLLRQQPTSTELLLPTQSTQPLSGLEATASASAQSEADGREAQHVAQHSATKQAHAGRNGGSADMPAAKTAEQDELQAAARPESQGAAVVTQRGSKQVTFVSPLPHVTDQSFDTARAIFTSLIMCYKMYECVAVAYFATFVCVLHTEQLVFATVQQAHAFITLSTIKKRQGRLECLHLSHIKCASHASIHKCCCRQIIQVN